MITYQLTQEQYEQIQGQHYSPYQIFNLIQDIDDNWCLILTDEDLLTIAATEWVWILICPRIEYKPKPMPNPFEQE